MAERGGLLLRGAVQHYEWGGLELIPSLLGVSNEAGRPFAELWLGAHPKAPALVEDSGNLVPLDRYVEACPHEILGAPAAAVHGNRLPYLMKVLDARKMLSIQAHPTRRQAEEGFRRENEAGVALDAPGRNYKDTNHKPEVHVALTDFWMLHGFRPIEDIARTLREVPELSLLLPDLGAGLRGLYAHVMTMPQERVNAMLDPLIARLEAAGPLDKDTPDFWALRASREFPLPGGGRDRGLFSIYLLNLVRLEPGQGTYQPAGVLHAYLEGSNVELMANSDNVLRGGLTPKHVDVDELLRAVCFESGKPEVIEGTSVSPEETVFRTPAGEFELSRIELGAGRTHSGTAPYGPETLIVLEGEAVLRSAGTVQPLVRGNAVFAACGCRYALEAKSERAVLFKAAIPAARR